MATGVGFEGKVGLVVGGTSGMGNAVVRLLSGQAPGPMSLTSRRRPTACSIGVTSATTARFAKRSDRW